MDSIESDKIITYNLELKNVLYDFTVQYTNEITEILYNHKYPGIDNVENFIVDVTEFIRTHNKNNNCFLKMLNNELQMAKKQLSCLLFKTMILMF